MSIVSQRIDLICYLSENVVKELNKKLRYTYTNVDVIDIIANDEYENDLIKYLNCQIDRFNNGNFEIRIDVINKLYKVMY